MLTRILALGALVTATVQAQIYEMQILLQGDPHPIERFGADAWTTPSELPTFVTLLYDTRLTALPAAPGSLVRTYPSNGPHNRWELDIGYEHYFGLIPSLQVSDTELSMHFADAATQTTFDVSLVFRVAPPPGRLLPMFDWGPQPGSTPDFTDQQVAPANPAAPFISSYRFSTHSGFGLDPGGFRSEVYEGRYLMEQYAEPPPVLGPVPEPATFGFIGGLLGLAVVLRSRVRSRGSPVRPLTP
jgi:hypothetical protein